MKFFKLFIILYLITFIWLGSSIYANDSNYNFESNASGIFKIQSMMLIDEMPAQFNGMVNISGDVNYNENTKIPIIFGILTTYTYDEALSRSHPLKKNKGAEVMNALLKTMSTYDKIQK